jgi:hypothetical protein
MLKDRKSFVKTAKPGPMLLGIRIADGIVWRI